VQGIRISPGCLRLHPRCRQQCHRQAQPSKIA
jgi:hypothetical protein